jgi:hypothetical protein
MIVVSMPMPAAPVIVLKVLDRGVKVVAAAATLTQQEKNSSADVQRKGVKFNRLQR